MDPSVPALAICLANGRVQLMRNEVDDAPVLLDTGMKANVSDAP